MRTLIYAVLLLLAAVAAGEEAFQWETLPPLPEAVSGHFAGTHDGVLIVAGGSRFTVSPWQGGSKEWMRDVYVLKPGADAWKRAGQLPEPRAYGGSVSAPMGLLCIGGRGEVDHYADTLVLQWKDDALTMTRGIDAGIPPLPSPNAMGGATLLNGRAYVVGGQSSGDATEATHALWSLDLSNPAAGWQAEPPWPGPARILPVLAAQSNGVYLISGASLAAGPDGKAVRSYLRDGYCYQGGAWKAIAPMGAPVVAAPGLGYGQAHILVFSGDDGSLYARTEEVGDSHPGFTKGISAYHTITDTWTTLGNTPAPYVTTTVVEWNKRIVIPGGEDRPGHRAAAVHVAKALPPTGGFNAVDYATLVLYFGVLVGMGAYFSRRESTTENFCLGGRKVPWWAVGLSIFGTSLSAITYLSIPARAYATDWVYSLANMSIIVLAPIVIAFYLPHYRRAPITTAYEYLEQRFNLLTRIYGSVCFMLFQIGRVAIVLYLPSIALSAATGFNIYYCIAAMGILATVYTVLGGIEAVIWTDVLQAAVLVVGAVMALVLVLLDAGSGPLELIRMAAAEGKFHTFNWTWDYTAAAVWVVVIGNVISSLYPATADQTVVQRYLTTKTNRDAAKAIWTNALLTIPITVLFFGLGTAMWAYFRQHPEALNVTLQNDATLPLFVVREFPLGLRGIIIAGVFAAAMSSLDSSMNSVASVMVHDWYRRFRPSISDLHALNVARAVTLAFGVFGTVMAMYVAGLETTTLWDAFLKLLNYVGGGLAGVFALGVFTRRTHGAGAIVGAVASAGALYYASTYTAMHFFLHGLVAFATAVIVGYGVSLVLPGRKPHCDV
ncbi:MAG: sodium/solute symporter [Candidatus Hydrogenedentes bacterium]|nr:sodium/solute symporter [Candidatus Hydrogenedentota bacterium]